MLIKSIIGATLLFMLVAPVQASIIVSYYEDGSNLKFDWSGSWDTNGYDTANYAAKYIRSTTDSDYAFYGFNGSYSRIAKNATYTQTVGTGIFANYFNLKSGSMSGDTLGIAWVSLTNAYLYAPGDYIAGQNILGSMTIGNTSIASIGLADASFDFGDYGDVHFKAANPVPEPATILLLGSGLAGLAFYRRKRK